MMTNKEAIEHLKNINRRYPCSLDSTFRDECEKIAINMAIKALKERTQGEWECARIGNTNFITCSHCKEQFETENTLELWQDEYKFCHRCGAKMERSDEDDNSKT